MMNDGPMPDDSISLTIDGHPIRVPPGTSVAAAVLIARGPGFRRSVTGQLRGPLCGMGICYECRLTIDGYPQRTSCQTLARAGMEVRTDVP
jgi:predicted molibdopterin-dependent oxidoreductase YjgC